MKTPVATELQPVNSRRRRFVTGLASLAATAGTVVGVDLLHSRTALAASSMSGMAHMTDPAPLEPDIVATPGTTVLHIAEQAVNFTGRPSVATTVNGTLPGPTMRWRQGQQVSVDVINHLDTTTSIHWHGILLPYRMDGVPGISFDGIAPGATMRYRFPARQAGTYWYHSHSGFQEQVGLYGAIVIEPEHGDPIAADRDYVVMLNDWTDTPPSRIFDHLKKSSDYYNYQQPTVPEFLHDVRAMGWSQAWKKRAMWNQMRMSPVDFSDVSSAAYTYLLNGQTPAANWTGIAKAGERVRLRFINGSAETYFDVRIPGLKMTVIATDGQAVEPVVIDEFRIAVAETYDVLVTMPDDRAYTLFAQSMDRGGYARGTLAPTVGMQAEVPPLGAQTWLSTRDMGMSRHMSMDMSSAHGQHGAMAMAMPDMSQDTLPTTPSVDMRVMHPDAALDDPGPRLRDDRTRREGQVLTYADLRTLGGSLDPRKPSRELTLRLTGNMARFIWGFDGVAFEDAEPIRFLAGEKLRIILINDTMMNHPIHLHGMFSELEDEQGRFLVRKHTINVQPAKRLAFQISATELGQWAFHCHLLYHMEAGMMRKVVVA